MSEPLTPPALASDLGSWRAQAACQFGDHELFFPPEEEQGEYFRLRVSLAKRICRGCPVRRPCADYALAADERYGLWGADRGGTGPAVTWPRRGLTDSGRQARGTTSTSLRHVL